MVEFSNDGMTHTEGPAAWLQVVTMNRSARVQDDTCSSMRFGWCRISVLFQMYMRDSLHQIDHGVIIRVLREYFASSAVIIHYNT